MNEPSNIPNPPSGYGKELFFNRFCVCVGLLPFIPSGLLALASGKPLTFLLPLYGFCPFDLANSSPPSLQVLLWGCVTGIICLAFAIYAFFMKPYGIFFALTT